MRLLIACASLGIALGCGSDEATTSATPTDPPPTQPPAPEPPVDAPTLPLPIGIEPCSVMSEQELALREGDAARAGALTATSNGYAVAYFAGANPKPWFGVCALDGSEMIAPITLPTGTTDPNAATLTLTDSGIIFGYTAMRSNLRRVLARRPLPNLAEEDIAAVELTATGLVLTQRAAGGALAAWEERTGLNAATTISWAPIRADGQRSAPAQEVPDAGGARFPAWSLPARPDVTDRVLAYAVPTGGGLHDLRFRVHSGDGLGPEHVLAEDVPLQDGPHAVRFAGENKGTLFAWTEVEGNQSQIYLKHATDDGVSRYGVQTGGGSGERIRRTAARLIAFDQAVILFFVATSLAPNGTVTDRSIRSQLLHPWGEPLARDQVSILYSSDDTLTMLRSTPSFEPGFAALSFEVLSDASSSTRLLTLRCR